MLSWSIGTQFIFSQTPREKKKTHKSLFGANLLFCSKEIIMLLQFQKFQDLYNAVAELLEDEASRKGNIVKSVNRTETQKM